MSINTNTNANARTRNADENRPCPKCKQNMRFVAWSLEWDNTKICHGCRAEEDKRQRL